MKKVVKNYGITLKITVFFFLVCRNKKIHYQTLSHMLFCRTQIRFWRPWANCSRTPLSMLRWYRFFFYSSCCRGDQDDISHWNSLTCIIVNRNNDISLVRWFVFVIIAREDAIFHLIEKEKPTLSILHARGGHLSTDEWEERMAWSF